MKLSFGKKAFLTIFVILLGLELVNYFPSFLPPVLIILLAFFLFALFSTFKVKPQDRTLYPIFVLPLILLTEAFFIINVIPIISLKHLFIIAFGFLLYLVIFSLNSLKNHIVSYSIIIFNILTIAYLIAVFFAYIVLYNFYLFFDLPVWMVMMLVGSATFLFFLFYLWKNLLLKDNFYFYSILLTVVMIEFFWVLTFWPLLALYSGFILFITYYAYSGIIMLHLKKKLNKKSLLNYTAVPFVIIVFFLISIKW